MTIVNSLEARKHFSELLNRVARGEKITITRLGVQVALLLPIVAKPARLTHHEIVQGMRALRKRVKPGKMSVRDLLARGRRF